MSKKPHRKEKTDVSITSESQPEQTKETSESTATDLLNESTATSEVQASVPLAGTVVKPAKVKMDVKLDEKIPKCDLGLLDEVQAFFNQRESLAEKLAKEIEATESKLAELRQTMTRLFPDRTVSPGKDRKAKKPKKIASRNEAAADENKENS